MHEPTVDVIYRPARTVVARTVGDEAVVLDLQSERYLALDEVGARVWALLDGRRDCASIAGTLADEYEAPIDQIKRDVEAFVAQLVELGLVEGARSSCEA
jgi:hypothetical protein